MRLVSQIKVQPLKLHFLTLNQNPNKKPQPYDEVAVSFIFLSFVLLRFARILFLLVPLL